MLENVKRISFKLDFINMQYLSYDFLKFHYQVVRNNFNNTVINDAPDIDI